MSYKWKTSRTALERAQIVLEQGTAQRSRMFRLLRGRKGKWVSLPELGKAGSCRCVSAVMGALRRDGCDIENRRDTSQAYRGAGEAGVVKSWYRLLKEPKEKAAELS